MSDLIKLVKTYRVMANESEQLRLAEQILPLIENKIAFFVFGPVRTSDAEDIYQEALTAIFTHLESFRGGTVEEFWAWCYQVTRNKMFNYFKKKKNDRMELMPPEELFQVADDVRQNAAISAADRLDLEYALKLLDNSRPECRDYLWNHFVFGFKYAEIATQQNSTPDAVRMKIGRCLEQAQMLLT